MTAAELLGALLALDADTLRETGVCVTYGGDYIDPVRSVFVDDGTLWISDGDPEPETIELYPDDGQCAERERQAADALRGLIDAAKEAEAWIMTARDIAEDNGLSFADEGPAEALLYAIAKVEGGS